MRRAAADAIQTPPELALVAHVSPALLRGAVPVSLQAMDAFSEPEPSNGATIELASGRHVIVIYGLTTNRLSVHAAWPDAPAAISDFLRESALSQANIEWVDSRLSALIRMQPDETLAARR